MMRLGILLAGLVVCLPALVVAVLLRETAGAPLAAWTAFAFIYSPFALTALFAGQFREMLAELVH
jgi:hypothetical protein